MDSSAVTAQARLIGAALSPWPNLCPTTSTSPAKPSVSPNHWRAVTRPPVADSHTAVSTGCNPTISADSPAPMPALTAAHTPPR